MPFLVRPSDLKRQISDFEVDFRRLGYCDEYHRDFLSMFYGAMDEQKDKAGIIALVAEMDSIDASRNAILLTLNRLLSSSGMKEFDLITLSSKLRTAADLGTLPE